MVIKFNSDPNMVKSQEQVARIKTYIKDELRVYSNDISRIEANISEENGSKTGLYDKRCMLEAQVENWQSIAVTSFASTSEYAVAEALIKLKKAVETMLKKLDGH
jgi:hypothetical protein